MDNKKLLENIKKVREKSKKRGFEQTFDLIFNLQSIDLKKPEHKVDVGISLPTNTKPKKVKVCAIVDQSIEGADKIFDKVLFTDELSSLKNDMKKIREVTHKYDKFVVLSTLMPTFAGVLGRYLGPMNKMPSPKLGMVINPKTNLSDLYEKIQKTVHLATKKNLVLQASIGSEKISDEDISKNISIVYDQLIHSLVNGKNNIKNVKLKLTMGGSVEL